MRAFYDDDDAIHSLLPRRSPIITSLGLFGGTAKKIKRKIRVKKSRNVKPKHTSTRVAPFIRQRGTWKGYHWDVKIERTVSGIKVFFRKDGFSSLGEAIEARDRFIAEKGLQYKNTQIWSSSADSDRLIFPKPEKPKKEVLKGGWIRITTCVPPSNVTVLLLSGKRDITLGKWDINCKATFWQKVPSSPFDD